MKEGRATLLGKGFDLWRSRVRGWESRSAKGVNLRVAVVLGVQVGRHFGALLYWAAAALLSHPQFCCIAVSRLSSRTRTRTYSRLSLVVARRTTENWGWASRALAEASDCSRTSDTFNCGAAFHSQPQLRAKNCYTLSRFFRRLALTSPWSLFCQLYAWGI